MSIAAGPAQRTADSDHFFTGHLDRLQKEIESWARERLWAVD